MNEPMQIDHDAFMRLIDDKRLKMLQVIHLAVPFGVLIFTLLVVFLYLQIECPGNDSATSAAPIPLLTLMHAIIGLVCFTAGQLLYNRLSGPRGSQRQIKLLSSMKLSEEEICFRAIFTATIFRLALFEGAAIFGLIICLIAALSGILSRYPIYWLNTFSVVMLIVLVAVTFPTRSRIESLFLSRFTDKTPFNSL